MSDNKEQYERQPFDEVVKKLVNTPSQPKLRFSRVEAQGKRRPWGICNSCDKYTFNYRQVNSRCSVKPCKGIFTSPNPTHFITCVYCNGEGCKDCDNSGLLYDPRKDFK